MRLGPEHGEALGRFFAVLSTGADAEHFRPHPLTTAAARELASHAGEDLYFVAVENSEILAYGMLRGWDEGFAVPSLGIAVHPDARGQGVGRAMMEFLRLAARRRGARRLRLTVDLSNAAAIRLYAALGYTFEAHPDRPALVGHVDI